MAIKRAAKLSPSLIMLLVFGAWIAFQQKDDPPEVLDQILVAYFYVWIAAQGVIVRREVRNGKPREGEADDEHS